MCQYSRLRPLSSEKHETLRGAGAKEGSGHVAGVVTATVVGHYRPLPEPTEVMSRAARAPKVLRFRTPARLYVYDTLLERLPQDLQPWQWNFGSSSRKSTPL